MKKKDLNAKRKRGTKQREVAALPAKNDFDEELTDYLQSTLSMIEGRSIGEAEIKEHMESWQGQLRQYSLSGNKKIRTLPDD